ncbi:MAG: hypothetical protein Q8922_14820 [Bacteroidota bacterium]|nr:hypothetical protein [Bacteroidota bacterium]MDP4234548.1 hypothetical protein [Bacteroidota bacterium]MDP4242613.1 hypothetical protein [Bacteroidota bacterium]MDP4289189.1 hypothetical protein [Bacteroidota bacterium]
MNSVLPPHLTKNVKSGTKKKNRWYKRPTDYDDVAWETRKLVLVTVALGFFTFLAAAGTIAVVLVGLRQSAQTDSALGISRLSILKQDSSAQLQLRAYVGFQKGVGFDTAQFLGQFEFVNNGSTPAYDVQVISASLAGVSPPDTAFSYRDENGRIMNTIDSRGTLGPRASTLVPANAPNLTTEQRAALRRGFGSAYYYGRIAYRDIFWKWHTTNYRMKFWFDRPGHVVLSPDAKGNESD